MDKASAADTVDLGLIIVLVTPKLEKNLYLHTASRLNISNKMGSVNLSPRVVDRWVNDSLSRKMNNFFAVCIQLNKYKCNYFEVTKKLSKCAARSVRNVNFF